MYLGFQGNSRGLSVRGWFFISLEKFQYFHKVNCPHGCPCDSFDCSQIEDPDWIIEETIPIRFNQSIAEIPEYSLDYSLTFEVKMNRSVANTRANCAQLVQGNY